MMYVTRLLYLSNQFFTKSSLHVKHNMKVTLEDKVGVFNLIF